MNILIFNFNSVMDDVIEELQKRGHNILAFDGMDETAKKADVIVVWNEIDFQGNRDWIKKQLKRGKRVVLVQHGRKGTSRIYPPFNETLVSDVVCSWGENDKKRLMSVGVPEERIKVCGTPIFRHLKPRVKHKGYNVVFCPEHWDGEVEENLFVADELRKLKRLGFKKINVITKVLEGEHREEWYQNIIRSKRNAPGHFNVVADVLSKADLICSISDGTFEMLAMSLDIPVVIADCWVPKSCNNDERYKQYFREYSPAVAKVPLSELNKTIKLHLKHPEILREERKKIVVADGGTNIANPIDEIIKVILDGQKTSTKRPRSRKKSI